MPVGSERLVESRPLIEWMLSLLPEGGRDDQLRELSEDDLDEIADGFFGPSWAGSDLRPLIDEVLAVGSANGIGDPLVWGRHNVDQLLDPRLWRIGSSTPHLERTPELLRDLIRYGHAERELRPQLTTDALAAVDAAADNSRATVRALDDG